jgi:hypothetical protein
VRREHSNCRRLTGSHPPFFADRIVAMSNRDLSPCQYPIKICAHCAPSQGIFGHLEYQRGASKINNRKAPLTLKPARFVERPWLQPRKQARDCLVSNPIVHAMSSLRLLFTTGAALVAFAIIKVRDLPPSDWADG